jgi:autotransporter-associated beta strand protein
VPASGNGIFGNSAGGNLLLGDISGTNSATLLMAAGFTNGRPVTVRTGSTGTKTLGVSGTGDATFSDVTLADDATLSAGTGAQVEFGSPITESVSGRSVTVTGGGTVKFSGANTFTGNLNINGGTLLLGAADRIHNSANIVLGGGTFATGGFNETVGTLTLSASSSIDLGAGASVLHFATGSPAWTASTTVTINNWSGVLTGGGTDELIFGSSASGLTAGQLAQIQFFNPLGLAPGTYGAQILGTGEVVPVPESATGLAALAALGFVGFAERRRFRPLTNRLAAAWRDIDRNPARIRAAVLAFFAALLLFSIF